MGGGGGRVRAGPLLRDRPRAGPASRGDTPSSSHLPGLIFLRKKREQSRRPGQPPWLWRCQDDVPRGFSVMAPGVWISVGPAELPGPCLPTG